MNRLWIVFLLIASILDASLTDLGIRLQLIGEANPIMSYLYDHLYVGFYALKIALPVSLFFLMAKIRKGLLIRGLLQCSVCVYIGILSLHTYWISASVSALV